MPGTSSSISRGSVPRRGRSTAKPARSACRVRTRSGRVAAIRVGPGATERVPEQVYGLAGLVGDAFEQPDHRADVAVEAVVVLRRRLRSPEPRQVRRPAVVALGSRNIRSVQLVEAPPGRGRRRPARRRAARPGGRTARRPPTATCSPGHAGTGALGSWGSCPARPRESSEVTAASSRRPVRRAWHRPRRSWSSGPRRRGCPLRRR